jgi:hypothetical protein
MAFSAGITLAAESVTAGGFSLEWHLMKSSASDRIQESGCAFAVLQDHSLQTIERPAQFPAAVSAFALKIKAAGATPVLFQTWARRHKPDMQPVISGEYAKAAGMTSSILAPVGEAWKQAIASSETLVLHEDDDSHPLPAGTYLSASVIASSITGKPASSICAAFSGQHAAGPGSEMQLLEELTRFADLALSGRT